MQHIVRFLLVAAQLYALYKVANIYSIESAPFRRLLMLCFGAFVVHHFLPSRARLWFFLAVCIAGLALVFGTQMGAWDGALAATRTGWLVGIVAGIVLICHLPAAFLVRVGILVAAGAALWVARANPAKWPVPPAIWPILGSMLMFRVIVYMHHLKHEREPFHAARAFSYFLMIPNVCFPLFPVVDYKAFIRSRFNADAFVIYQTGLDWILRGFIHLALYRLVYYQLYITPGQVESGSDLVRFLVTNLALYLRVSGQFHVIVGLLHLFGFNLTETHNKYYLSSSFTDYWRRINIYWKDFIQKTVFYPVYFRVKSLGPTRAMVIGTLVAFLVTWILHDYQGFWLKGRFTTRPADAIFWGALGLLVAGNAVLEARRGRKRTLGARRATVREEAVRAVKTAGVFCTICVLWSLWTTPTVGEWLEIWRAADSSAILPALGVFAVIALAAVTPGIRPGPLANAGVTGGSSVDTRRWIGGALLKCFIPAVVMYALVRPEVSQRLGSDYSQIVRTVVSENRPTANDENFLQRGYYEDLIDVGLINSPLSEVFMKRPASFKHLEHTDALRPASDFRVEELVPNKRTEANNTVIETNSLGIRDREYALEKPADTVRIAYFGASVGMGWLVQGDEAFEPIVEQRANERWTPASGKRFESMNFCQNRHGPIATVLALKEKALAFNLDAAVYISQGLEPYWSPNRMAKAIREGLPFPSPEIEAIAKRAGVTRGTPIAVAERRLTKEWKAITEWSFREFVRASRERGVRPVWLFVPWYDRINRDADIETVRAMAVDAGFEIVDLRGMWDGTPIESVTIASWDWHPNAAGHRMIADAIYEGFLSTSEFLPGAPVAPVADSPSSGSPTP